ncbi:conserved exported hypothetical protein [Candidatus Nitrosotenuis uzonensis]|uniref:Uncharacterized protein n=2 Tax=Candidatus Nitrosotenuis uzonensis TaxID=1407055 RepID=A0A812F2A9_9ARCH|nr:conserved exported hypothetical protein [Candidatus Nitrosotenuis uzonensis]
MLNLLCLLLIFSLIPMSLAFAQERQIAMSSQIIVRDSDHRLVAYLEVNKIEYVSLGALHTFLDQEYNPRSDQTISVNGQNMQIIRRSIDYIADSDNVISDTTLNVNLGDRVITLVRPIHDGIPVRAGDTITVIWTFIRAV